MNIAVDAFPLTGETFTGIPNYVKNIVSNLLLISRLNNYFLYSKNPVFDINETKLIQRFDCLTSRPAKSFKNTLWLFTGGVRLMKRDNIDIFWGTRQMLPPYLPGHVKKVLTVYDLVWHYFPETMGSYNRLVSMVLGKRAIKSADHIITISKATAGALSEVTDVSPEKISVIYPAAGTYNPLDKKAAADYIADKYGNTLKYILTVSTVEPRKNLTTLLRALGP